MSRYYPTKVMLPYQHRELRNGEIIEATDVACSMVNGCQTWMRVGNWHAGAIGKPYVKGRDKPDCHLVTCREKVYRWKIRWTWRNNAQEVEMSSETRAVEYAETVIKNAKCIVILRAETEGVNKNKFFTHRILK